MNEGSVAMALVGMIICSLFLVAVWRTKVGDDITK